MACGLCAGRLLGNRFMESIIMEQGRFPLLLSRPVNRFYDIYALIHSENSFSRMSGYYGLADNRMINLEFLSERFRLEREDPLRKTVLWILSYSNDTSGVLKFYLSVYKESGDSVKRRILELMMRVSNDYYIKFVRTNRIDAKLLPKGGREINNDVRF
jgi:hypothetical protein